MNFQTDGFMWLQGGSGDIESDQVRVFLSYWQKIGNGREMPSRADVDPIAIPKLLPNISMVDVSYNPLIFRIRLFGTVVANHQSAKNGMSVEEIPETQGRERILARYRACVESRKPICDMYLYTDINSELRQGEAITCPLSNDGQNIDILISLGVDRGFAPAA